jgi:alkylhydroperoxidase family enzyme
MTTLRIPGAEDLPDDDREVLERVARRLGVAPDQASMIWRAQYHWPQLLEANHRQTLYGYRLQGAIPSLTKEAMHVAVSMVNRCEF